MTLSHATKITQRNIERLEKALAEQRLILQALNKKIEAMEQRQPKSRHIIFRPIGA